MSSFQICSAFLPKAESAGAGPEHVFRRTLDRSMRQLLHVAWADSLRLPGFLPN